MTAEIIEIDPKPVMPALSLEDALHRHQVLADYVHQFLREGTDYGRIPGCAKPTLLKPGAEKLIRLFGLTLQFDLVASHVDWQQGLFAYHYRCALSRRGLAIAAGDGCCNSRERKFLRQIQEGKQTVFDLQNTICKMAQKRAMLAATLVATSGSEFFAQDLEERVPASASHRKPKRRSA